MRAREFILERKIPERKSSVMSFAKHFPTMPSSDPYQAYRFGMALADPDISKTEGPAVQHAVVLAYTAEEEDKIRSAESHTGHKGLPLTDRQSHEPKLTNKRSPVANIKKNRYGV